jgi:hypothetical protein
MAPRDINIHEWFGKSNSDRDFSKKMRRNLFGVDMHPNTQVCAYCRETIKDGIIKDYNCFCGKSCIFRFKLNGGKSKEW